TRFRRDGRSRQRVVARDHDGLDTHAAQLAEALLDAAFHDVLELDDAEHARAIGDEQRRAAAARDLLRRRLHALRKERAERFDVLLNGVRRTLAHLAIANVD